MGQCPVKNTAFKAGEVLTYDLYFNWKFVWIKVGNASMDISNTRYKGKDAYRCHLITRGSKRADKFNFGKTAKMSSSFRLRSICQRFNLNISIYFQP
jgi:hypothetical protein